MEYERGEIIPKQRLTLLSVTPRTYATMSTDTSSYKFNHTMVSCIVPRLMAQAHEDS